MYIPRSHREEDTSLLHDLVRRYNFATLFSWTHEGPAATHVPFELEADRGGPYGTLLAHVARANPHWRSLDGEREVLVAFVGPHAYISPSWYVDPVTVPTWNYAAVHVYGVPRLIHDTARLREHVLRLSRLHEAHLSPPWDPINAEPVLAANLKAIVGIEIPITRIEGKFKFNQNRSREDQAGVAAALERSADPLARAVAEIMRRNLDTDGGDAQAETPRPHPEAAVEAIRSTPDRSGSAPS